MTWIKICGTTNVDDALMSVEAGADALGFVFWESSPRNVDARTVRKIVEKLPPQTGKVGVFVREPFEHVSQIVEEAGLTAAQLHYANLSEEGWALTRYAKYIVAPAGEFADIYFSKAAAAPKWMDTLFLDSGTPQNPGGTGKTFDWKRCKPHADIIRRGGCKLVVAGGLTPENVDEAIRILEPWGVDVASGVEASPGQKDPAKVRAFIQAVKNATKK